MKLSKKPISNRTSPVNLLPNGGNEQNQYAAQASDKNEAKMPTFATLLDDKREINVHLDDHRDYENTWAWLRANSIEQERFPSSQSPQDEQKYCYQNITFLLIVILLGVLSTALCCVFGYLVLGVDRKCQCSSDNNYIKGHAISQNFTEVLIDLKAKLKHEIKDLTNKKDNSSRTLNDEHQCDENSKNCRKKSHDGFHDAYQETLERLERFYNKTEENIGRKFQQIKARVEKISELNEKPNCLLKQAKQSKNDKLVTVQVPKRTENSVTVAVTCSTTLQHTADVRYMVPSSHNQDVYTCYCENKVDKQSDCVAYYWQCRL